MAKKKLTLPVDLHLKKFLEYHFQTLDNGRIFVEKSSWLGHLIFLSSQHIPFTQPTFEAKGTTVTIEYYSREKARDILNAKIPEIVKQIDETFRLSLVHYVASVRFNLQTDYTPYVSQFLKIIDYDPDCGAKELDTLRKIYRDYEAKIEKKNQKRFA